jgi:hypothetical protein
VRVSGKDLEVSSFQPPTPFSQTPESVPPSLAQAGDDPLWVLDADMVAERTRFPVTRTGAVTDSSSAVTVTVPFVPSASGPFTSTGISAEPPAGIVTRAGADAVNPADAAAFTGTVTARRSRFVTRNRASAAVPGVTGTFTPNGGSTASCVRSCRTAVGVRTANVHEPDPTS